MWRRRPTVPPEPGFPVELPAVVTGDVRVLGGVLYLVPDLDDSVDLLPLQVEGPRPASGAAVVAELLPIPPGAPRAARPFARLLRVLGPAGELAAEVERLLVTHELREEFPAGALGEAEALPPGVGDGQRRAREDLTGLPLVTIDGADARDFDDAVAALPLEDGGWSLVVAIADVAHHVPEGGALDTEARLRGTSVYLPGRCLPMLPPRLSDDLCSLRPDEERLAMAVLLDLDPEGRRRGVRFSEAVIRSRARLTYDEVEATLDGRQAKAGPAWAFREHLARLAEVAGRLRSGREARGALDLEVHEPEVILDGDSVADVRRRPRLLSHRLVEEAMVAANEAVGQHLAELGLACLDRVHPPPDPGKLLGLAKTAAAYGFELRVGRRGAVSSRALARLLEETAGAAIGPALHHLALRTLSKAEYALDDVGHFGLAAKGYLHFTSPIRRYPDLLVHRVLKAWLAGGRPPDAEALAPLAESCTETERRAMLAEFAVLDLYRCLALRDRLGEEFWGTITSVVHFGVFVTLDAPFVEGLVHVSDLGWEWFDHVPTRLELVARETGRTFRLGQRLRLTVASVDPRQRHVGLVPA